MGMTIDEVKNKMDFLKKAYQKLIDEKVDSGKLVGDGVSGEWKAETPLDEVYKDIIEALDLAIKALEQQPCEDCISRDETLKAFAEKCGGECGCCVYNGSGYDSAENCKLIKSMPSVAPQRQKGENE